ncbi:MAG TPA: hypothetical protein VFQ86_02625, partial [Arachidicoccus soli]|nr:hypothetical protein [Arachidicoccus soli]
ASCQRFACGFLQIPSHPGHLCRSANCSPYRANRNLSSPRNAPCRAHNEKARRYCISTGFDKL